MVLFWTGLGVASVGGAAAWREALRADDRRHVVPYWALLAVALVCTMAGAIMVALSVNGGDVDPGSPLLVIFPV